MDGQQEKPENQQRDPRVRLAAERTLLAWVRTGLAVMGFGFVIARFGLFLQELASTHGVIPERPSAISMWLGIGMVLLGIGVNILAALEFRTFIRRYERNEPDRLPHWSLGMITALILACFGAILVGYLLSL